MRDGTLGVIRIGTSGWTYPDWKGRFYPEKLAQRKWLEHYAATFDAVELNASFYRIPRRAIVEGWRDRTPECFVFAVKMSRLASHVRRLRECKEVLDWFFGELGPLSAKTVAYLVQLPPGFRPEEGILEEFLSSMPPNTRVAFEFRDERCYTGRLLQTLEKSGAGFCIHDLPGRETPLTVTSRLVYLRFHGHGRLYGGSYPHEVLAGWAERLKAWDSEGRDVLAFFNNDQEACAVCDALALREMLAAG